MRRGICFTLNIKSRFLAALGMTNRRWRYKVNAISDTSAPGNRELRKPRSP